MQVSAGDSHNLALDATGRVFVWGSGKHGRLGLGDELFRATPVCLDQSCFADESPIASISAGAQHSACISSTGTLYTWG